MSISVEMPKWKCHKEVHALKIAAVKLDGEGEDRETDGTGWLVFEDSTVYAPINVSREYMRRHQPKSGGYYVVYPGGYESWSPAEAFEAGYTRL